MRCSEILAEIPPGWKRHAQVRVVRELSGVLSDEPVAECGTEVGREFEPLDFQIAELTLGRHAVVPCQPRAREGFAIDHKNLKVACRQLLRESLPNAPQGARTGISTTDYHDPDRRTP